MKSIQYFPLDQIDSNPFQTRAGEDPEHIKQLALSIHRDTLLQVPIGRWVGDRVQLAFGHSRLAAYRWLNERVGPAGLDGDFSTFPVVIRELSDQEMFELAVRENNDRRDLTPVETARAMSVYREHFGKTSAEIGVLWGLSDSAVRNKIRLLNLPEDVQVQAGQISERVLREILTLFDLPARVREGSERYAFVEIRSSDIVRSALSGEYTADVIHSRIKRLVVNESIDMSDAPWKFDRVFDHPEVVGICKTCEFRFMFDGANRCANETCYALKGKLVKLEYLQAASDACGIPVTEDLDRPTYQYNDLGYSEERAKVILQSKCENLRLVYDKTRSSKSIDRVEGYPDARIMCSKRSGFCTCGKALDTGVHIDRKYEVVTDPETGCERVIENPDPQPLTAKDLKEIARETRQQKRQNVEECKAIREEAAKFIAAGLEAGNPVILHTVYQQLGWKYKNLEDQIDIENDFYGSADRVRLAIGTYLAEYMYSLEYGDPDPAAAVNKYNDLFKKARMRLMVDVSTETEEG